MRKFLIIYNLETNLDSSVLATSHAWIEELARYREKVFVFSTHVGRTELPDNVVLYELGGGTANKRLKNIKRITFSLPFILKNKKSIDVFYHMATRNTLYPGIILKIMKIPQILWYSHWKIPLSLKISKLTVDKYLSSYQGSFPLDVAKVGYIGHGIKIHKGSISKKRKRRIIILGRIAKVKRIEIMIEALAISNCQIEIDLFGLIQDKTYFSDLVYLADKNHIKMNYVGVLRHSEIQSKLKEYWFAYSGMQNSVDKSSLEAASCGVLVMSDQHTTCQATGMANIYDINAKADSYLIENQIIYLMSLTDEKLYQNSLEIAEKVNSENNIENLVLKINREFEKIKNEN